jgi:S-DNA-T family DNA segregation ATPase FtsK/SpoIIIE
MRSATSSLTIGLGKDAYGEPVCADIASMPHLLIAGATGTGKSVCINTVLVSLLYRASPEELGLILIDPKILELSVYEGIPHLRVPVVTNPKQARAVLDWATKEMDRRYRMLQKHGVRNIDGYNALVAGTSGAALKKAEEGSIQETLEPLSKLVIVIDELADLMLTVGREIEELITRLAQKARAAGIHLIVATQRPSVDVITGLIKANFPARLSFRVASRIDSRTILDAMGAEKLLGRGDMLFLQPGGGSPRRIHGAFVTDTEVKNVIEAVKKNGPPAYDERIIGAVEKAMEEEGSGGTGYEGSNEYDELYDKAVELVLEKGQASTSMVQRVFRIGYNRAARIIEQMERDGIVGPMDGVKPREVIRDGISSEEPI